MANDEHVAVLREGPKEWNAWRATNPTLTPDLTNINFETDIWEKTHFYDLPHLSGFDFTRALLYRVSARNSFFSECIFDQAKLSFSDLCFSSFNRCSFIGAEMRVARIGSSEFHQCSFEEADLGYCSAVETDFSGSRFVDCGLDHMRLVKSNFSAATIERVYVYGTSAWDLNTAGATQRDVYIDDRASLWIDDIEVAQFIHLLLRNAKLRQVIDTITSKVVLILGRFSVERKEILESLRTDFAGLGYVPVLFDFRKPESRDFTETVSTLAHLARFVVVDISEPRSVPHELATIIPALPSVPVQPIIQSDEPPYGMFEHWKNFPWVLTTLIYTPADVPQMGKRIVELCESAIGHDV